MKYIIILLGLFSLTKAKAQQPFEFASQSVAFQMGSGGKVEDTKGFILPSVLLTESGIDATNNANFGTIIFDVNDSTIKYLKAGNTWQNLTSSGDNKRVLNAFNQANLAGIKSLANTEEDSQVPTSLVKGILDLKTDDKGFVLPQIMDPHEKIIDPYPGFMCYDLRRGTLAIFDGVLWHYWK